MVSKKIHQSQDELVNGSALDIKSVASETNKTSFTTKGQIIRNLVVISLSFLLSFTAFSGTVNLQSSLNTEGDLGNKALTALNLGAIVSNLLLSTLMLNKLGLKWSLVISLAMHITFPAANFYPAWYTLYLGAVITGLGGGPLWSAKSAYLTILGEEYAAIVSETAEAAISRFFGIFFMIYRGSTLTGNVISSLILQRPPTSKTKLLPQTVMSKICGCNYCYQDLNAIYQLYNSNNYTNQSQMLDQIGNNEIFNTSFTNYFPLNETSNVSTAVNLTEIASGDSFYKPTTFQVYLLFGIYLLCGIIACPLMSLVTPLETENSKKNGSKQSVWSVVLATFAHMKDPKEIMLLPLAFFSGVSYAFITADYCVGFITCTIGIDNVGYVMTAFGAAAGLGAIVCGPLLKYTGRQSIFVFGFICNVGTIIGMLYWPPTPDTTVILYILAALWGISNAIWTSQLVAFIGFVFKSGNTEAAFACNFMWQMIGNCLWHAFSIYLCLDVQAYVMIAMLVIGMFGYLGVEILIFKENKMEKNHVDTELSQQTQKIDKIDN